MNWASLWTWRGCPSQNQSPSKFKRFIFLNLLLNLHLQARSKADPREKSNSLSILGELGSQVNIHNQYPISIYHFNILFSILQPAVWSDNRMDRFTAAGKTNKKKIRCKKTKIAPEMIIEMISPRLIQFQYDKMWQDMKRLRSRRWWPSASTSSLTPTASRWKASSGDFECRHLWHHHHHHHKQTKSF